MITVVVSVGSGTDWTCGAKVLKHTPFSKRDFCGLAWIMGEFRDSGHDSCLEGGARIVTLTNGSTRFVGCRCRSVIKGTHAVHIRPIAGRTVGPIRATARPHSLSLRPRNRLHHHGPRPQ